MDKYRSLSTRLADRIQGFKGSCVITEDGCTHDVGHAWIARLEPKVGDYLLLDTVSKLYSLCPARYFDNTWQLEQVINTTNQSPIAAAVDRLDPEIDAHWTKEGLPAMRVIERFVNDRSITREDVEAVRPGYTREESGGILKKLKQRVDKLVKN